MTQPDLFTEPYRVPHNHTRPSIEAARKVSRTSKTRMDEASLLVYIQDSGKLGRTDQEIAEHFGWTGDYTRPRRWTLYRKSQIKACGYRIVGRKKFTAYCIV